uniref:Glutaredoxin domain-containing protein n=1 Tax=Enterobius vermicularis TaxID=51028 RepID=A0A0N4UTU1_ENTVE
LPTLPEVPEYEEENDYTNYFTLLSNRNGPYNSYGYSYAGYIERQIRMYPIMMYTLVQCIPCERAKHVLAVSYRDVSSHFLELGGDEEWQRQLKVDLQRITGALTFPYIFLCGTYIGGLLQEL